MKEISARKLSNLEMTVLGLASIRGPVTIYAIMKDLSLSPSSYHKMRAGSTYAAANRLLKMGFLQRIDDDKNGQIEVSSTGRSELDAWLASPIPTREVEHTIDLIRLRVFFLQELAPNQRLEFLERAETQVKEFLKICQRAPEDCERSGEFFGALAAASLIIEAQARLYWLALVKKFLVEGEQQGYAEKILEAANLTPSHGQRQT